jgi:hypothetical protein
MNKKMVAFLVVFMVGLIIGAFLCSLRHYGGPSGAATGGAVGCGGEPIEGDEDVQEEPRLELPPVDSEVIIVEGNEALHQTKALLNKELMAPIQVKLGINEQEIYEVRLKDFQLELTEDAVEGPDDEDDLQFVNSMVFYIRSANPQSGLKERAIAWYYKDEAEGDDPGTIVFEVDDQIDLTPYADDGLELFSKSMSGAPLDSVSFKTRAIFDAAPF